MTVLRNGKRVGEWTTAELPQDQLIAKMLGHEARDAGGARGAPAEGDRSERGAGRPRRGRGPQRRHRAVRSRRSVPARSSAWPACSARAAPRSRGCSSAPTTPTRASVVATGPVKNPRVGDGRGDRVLPREPQDRGARARAHDPREHHPGDAGRARLDEADPAQAPGRAGREVDQGARHPPGQGRADRRDARAAATSRRCCSRAG